MCAGAVRVDLDRAEAERPEVGRVEADGHHEVHGRGRRNGRDRQPCRDSEVVHADDQQPRPENERAHAEQQLQLEGEPLRWAITAVQTLPDGTRRLQLEAVLLVGP